MFRDYILYAFYFTATFSFPLDVENEYNTNDVYTPKHFCVRLNTNFSAVIQWFEPMSFRFEILGYNLYYTKNPNVDLRDWTRIVIGNYPLVTIRNISLGESYTFRVQVNAPGLDGPGPISEPFHFRMLNRTRSCYDPLQKSLNYVRAAATSLTSVEVWWNLVHESPVFGFQIFYSLDTDSDRPVNKSVGTAVHSVQLTDLRDSATYRISIAAVLRDGLHHLQQTAMVKVVPQEVPLNVLVDETSSDSILLKWSPPTRFRPHKYRITYEASKVFVDSHGLRRDVRYELLEQLVDGADTSCLLDGLVPFTTYDVGVGAVPSDLSYRPSVNIRAKTSAAAPALLAKPQIYDFLDNQRSVRLTLPKASEEYGPIDVYYIIVVPSQGEEEAIEDVPSNIFTDLNRRDNPENEHEDASQPYVAAKFNYRIPIAFILGNGSNNEYVNKKLKMGWKYRVFVRAVVMTPKGETFTDSPYSEYIHFNGTNRNSL